VTGVIARRVASLVIAIAAALVIVGASIVPFLNPVWVGFEQDRSQAAAWTGYSPAELRTATGAILADLVFGPARFDVSIGGQPVLNDRERRHMADVRGVFGGFAIAIGAAVAVILVGAAVSRRSQSAARRVWSAVRSGAGGLAVLTVLVGGVGLVAFDAAFEIFHRLFFAGGTYDFDPRTDRLVQLFPDQFWLETSLAVGAVILVLSIATVWLASRRLAVTRSAELPVARVVEARS
jgi:integral membrane protein (TIGR01906 family)